PGLVSSPASSPSPAFVPSQPAAPQEETTSRSADAGDGVVSSQSGADESPGEMTSDELASMPTADQRPQLRESRKGRKARRSQGVGSAYRDSEPDPVRHRWDGLVAVPREAPRPAAGPQAKMASARPGSAGRKSTQQAPAANSPQARRLVAAAPPMSVPQLWS